MKVRCALIGAATTTAPSALATAGLGAIQTGFVINHKLQMILKILYSLNPERKLRILSEFVLTRFSYQLIVLVSVL